MVVSKAKGDGMSESDCGARLLVMIGIVEFAVGRAGGECGPILQLGPARLCYFLRVIMPFFMPRLC